MAPNSHFQSLVRWGGRTSFSRLHLRRMGQSHATLSTATHGSSSRGPTGEPPSKAARAPRTQLIVSSRAAHPPRKTQPYPTSSRSTHGTSQSGRASVCSLHSRSLHCRTPSTRRASLTMTTPARARMARTRLARAASQRAKKPGGEGLLLAANLKLPQTRHRFRIPKPHGQERYCPFNRMW